MAGRMNLSMVLVSLLLLGWTGTLQGLPVLPEPLYPTQENFDLTRFLGTWHDVALTSNCPRTQRHGGDGAIGKLVLERDTGDKLKVTRSVLRHGTCVEMSAEYELTSTPGRLFYHVERWGTDVDAYVVHTNYNEYAIVIMSRKLKTSGEKSTSVKLYSRTMSVRDTVLDDFKTLVGQQGISGDTIIIKQNKGDCVPGEQVEETKAQPEPKRLRRHVVPSLALADEEGSGDMAPLFNGTEACKAAPEIGPCYGSFPRFFYNSSSMSCERFTFGGCMGNQNNFLSVKECLQRCRTEAVCRLPLAPEPCPGHPIVWAFDSITGLCLSYKDGFCQSNANQFYSRAECQEYCGIIKDDGDLLTAN